jgi:general secretion pathway protein H
MGMRATSATGNDGFTLLELLVVLAILVLLAGAWPFAAPRLFPTQQLRNETQHLVSVLRIARTRARMTGQQQDVEILRSGLGYRFAAESHDLPLGLTLHLRDSEATVNSRRLAFYPDGSSSGGVLDLVLPSRTQEVRIGQLTGRAEIDD